MNGLHTEGISRGGGELEDEAEEAEEGSGTSRVVKLLGWERPGTAMADKKGKRRFDFRIPVLDFRMQSSSFWRGRALSREVASADNEPRSEREAGVELWWMFEAA